MLWVYKTSVQRVNKNAVHTWFDALKSITLQSISQQIYIPIKLRLAISLTGSKKLQLDATKLTFNSSTMFNVTFHDFF